MAQIRKMDCQLTIKSSADKFYDAFRTKAQLTPKMSNGLIADIRLLQGDWNSVGAVRLWSYDFEGKSYMIKEMLENVDDSNKTMVYKLVEGDLLNYYKSWRTILNITPAGDGSLVKWTVEFEKQNDDIPDPIKNADYLITLAANIDAYLLNV
ncbi:MLP-like protein 31 [Hibiscus trionum]|uniref:MLP-like protein 31 n=1 Tax=Hibiscus trionum TaxID=183268 RepID=A0A9W7MHF8_HIBTR|nr:MLP-like protein 31 [Hibiscus trionum]